MENVPQKYFKVSVRVCKNYTHFLMQLLAKLLWLFLTAPLWGIRNKHLCPFCPVPFLSIFLFGFYTFLLFSLFELGPIKTDSSSLTHVSPFIKLLMSAYYPFTLVWLQSPNTAAKAVAHFLPCCMFSLQAAASHSSLSLFEWLPPFEPLALWAVLASVSWTFCLKVLFRAKTKTRNYLQKQN